MPEPFKELVDFMEETGFTAYRIALDTELSEPAIRYWKTGERKIQPGNRKTLLKYFDEIRKGLPISNHPAEHNNKPKPVNLYEPMTDKDKIIQLLEEKIEYLKRKIEKYESGDSAQKKKDAV